MHTYDSAAPSVRASGSRGGAPRQQHYNPAGCSVDYVGCTNGPMISSNLKIDVNASNEAGCSPMLKHTCAAVRQLSGMLRRLCNVDVLSQPPEEGMGVEFSRTNCNSGLLHNHHYYECFTFCY